MKDHDLIDDTVRGIPSTGIDDEARCYETSKYKTGKFTYLKL